MGMVNTAPIKMVMTGGWFMTFYDIVLPPFVISSLFKLPFSSFSPEQLWKKPAIFAPNSLSSGWLFATTFSERFLLSLDALAEELPVPEMEVAVARGLERLEGFLPGALFIIYFALGETNRIMENHQFFAWKTHYK